MTTMKESTEIAVLQTQMKQVIDKQVAMEKKQDDHFATLSTKLDTINTTTQTISPLENRIQVLEKAKSRSWLWNTASAGVGALFFFLIQYVITHQ